MVAVLGFLASGLLKQSVFHARASKAILEELTALKSSSTLQQRKAAADSKSFASRLSQLEAALGGKAGIGSFDLSTRASPDYFQPEEDRTTSLHSSPNSIHRVQSEISSADIGDREKKFYDSLAALRQRRTTSPAGVANAAGSSPAPISAMSTPSQLDVSGVKRLDISKWRERLDEQIGSLQEGRAVMREARQNLVSSPDKLRQPLAL